jgi:hypothetical protein
MISLRFLDGFAILSFSFFGLSKGRGVRTTGAPVSNTRQEKESFGSKD